MIVLAAAVFLVGEKDFLFSRKTRYFILFERVGGLADGGAVQLNGVLVGKVDEVVLPEDAGETLLQVWISIEQRYGSRIRADSVARIQSLGLLGDKYISLTSGSPEFQEIEPDGQIQAAQVTDVDTLIASGGDAVENIVLTASSLSKILARMERGEGILGQLLMDDGSDENVLEGIGQSLETVRHIIETIDKGEGPIGRLIHDEKLARQLGDTIGKIESVVTKMNEGEGLLPDLLNNPKAKDRFEATLQSLQEASDDIEALTAAFKSGDGLLPMLLTDKAFAEEVSTDLRGLLEQLNSISEKLNDGEGAAAQFINDPQVYEAIQDILVGIDESKFLRWLVRSRQKKGIAKRYDDAQNQTPPQSSQ